MSPVLMGCSAAPLNRRTFRVSMGTCQAKAQVRGLPSSAMSSEVFPEPVGPTIKLIFPRWKSSSSSTLSTNLRLRAPPDACEGTAPLDQVKEAWRMPMTSARS